MNAECSVKGLQKSIAYKYLAFKSKTVLCIYVCKNYTKKANFEKKKSFLILSITQNKN